MKKNNIYDEIFDKPCSVCGKIIKKDIYEQGECPYCKWRNNNFADENPNNVIYPNLISLNKAKQLYKGRKPFEPNLDEFMEALHGYSEMQFEYKGIYYAVELVFKNSHVIKISLYNSQTKEILYFTDDADFKNNAKVEGKFLKDIWDETTDRYWLQ